MSTKGEAPKTPRWITTDAGRWAWQEYSSWRQRAASALSVQERARLLEEAERLQKAPVPAI